jgi:hypothetical protein
MAQIIQFPAKKVKPSTGYNNMTRLIAIADTAAKLNYYMETVGDMEKKGYLLNGEYQKLVEQGRSRQLEMAKPQLIKKQEVNGSGAYSYTPEMGGQKPDCQMEARLSHYGKHYFVDTPLNLKGRGITLVKKYKKEDFMNHDDHRVGWNEYRVTKKAFLKLKEEYSISMENYLD